MAKVVVFGTGQISDVIRFYLDRDSEHDVVAFTVDQDYMTGDVHQGLSVVAFERLEHDYPPSEFALSVPISYRDTNSIRAAKYEAAKSKGYRLINYVSSRAMVWSDQIGESNCIILENNVIQPFAQVGNDVVMWSGNHLGHHSKIGDHCFVSSHAVISGSVTIGDFCFLGVNSTIKDGVTIAARTVVAPGAVVLRNIETPGLYAGNPARLVS